jgi:S1-C subfamily serine protease
LRLRSFLILAALPLLLLTVRPGQANDNDSCRAAFTSDDRLRGNADPGLAAKACLAAAETSNDPKLQFMAGLVWEQGIGGKQDSVKAADWYRRAAEKGQPKAQLAMGRLAELRDDFGAALAWYGAAALKKNQSAQAAFLRLRIARPAAMWEAAEQAILIDDSLGDLADLAGSGSGIVLSDTIVLTNEHVVEHCDRMAVAPGLPAKVLAKDAERDLAVLQTTIPVGSAATLALAAEIGLEDTLFTGGYPGIGKADPTFMTTEGRRSARNIGKEGEEFWLLKNQIGPGNSGGPLLDSSGLVRGVVFASLPVTGIVKKSAPKGGHEGMAIRLDTVKSFLDQHKIAYTTGSVGPVAYAGGITKHIAGITVLVECFAR